MAGELVYSSALFERASVRRLADRYRGLLEQLLADPDRDLDHHQLVTDRERAHLLGAWSGRDAACPETTLDRLIEEQARRTPDVVAVEADEEHVSYATLDARANRLARALRARGVGPDVPVGVVMDRTAPSIVAFLGVLKAGGVYVPLDPQHPVARLEVVLREAGAAVVVGEEGALEQLAPLPVERLSVASTEALPAGSLRPLAAPANLAYVITTSGSTGVPKAIAMPHSGVVNLVTWQRRELGPARKVLQFAAPSFDVSIQEIATALADGSTLVLVDEETRRDPAALRRVLDERGVDRLFLPPAFLDAWGDRPFGAADVICAGAELRVDDDARAALAGARLSNHYGPAETHAVTSWSGRGDDTPLPAFPPIGRPTDNSRIYLLDQELELVPIGLQGEIHVGGAQLARGYLGRPRWTADRFVPNPFGPPGTRLYRTGDLGRFLVGGTLEFHGRADDQIELRGHRVEPGEVEAAILAQPGCRRAAVVPRGSAAGGARLVAYVVFDAAGDPAEVRERLAGRLPSYMVPAAVVALEELPLTRTGKLDRESLPEPFEQEPVESDERPQTHVEEAVAGIFAEVLRVPAVGVVSDFFQIGGHSLLAMQVTSRATTTFGVEIPMRLLFDAPTVRSFAREIELALIADVRARTAG